MNKTCAMIALCGATLSAAPPLASGQELVINGAFQTGDIAPSFSDYMFTGVATSSATYNVVAFDTLHPQWPDFFDATNGDSTGRFMVVNGNAGSPGRSWAQEVELLAGIEYVASANFASLFTDDPSLEFRLDGSPLSPQLVVVELAEWQRHSVRFSVIANGPRTLEIWDLSGAFIGNDYAIDDVSLRAVEECPGDIADDFGTIGADGMVGFGDFLALLGLVGPCPGMTPGCDGDIADDFGTLNGGDGMVSFGDFLALLGLVGPCP